MARIKNPLFSLSASGSIGKVVAFRATRFGSVCAFSPSSYSQNTENMLINQQAMINARSAFNTLSVVDLASWASRANAINKDVWPCFFSEYRLQRVTAPNMPLIPEAHLR